jgi:arginine decarboxylase
MLEYVGYNLDDLRAHYRNAVQSAALPDPEAAAVLLALEAGLSGYTYLRE